MYNPMQPPAPRTLHPVLPATVLPAVFMLERFAYYGVRSILILYMLQTLLLSQQEASSIYSLFTIAMFLMVIPAGIFNDFVLKPPLALIIGVAAEILGCGLLLVPSVYTMAGGILLLVIGSSLFKTAMYALLGTHYINSGRTHLLDSGYSVLYAGVNIGAFLAPIVIGGLSDTGNPAHFVYGFAIAAVAAVLALVLLLVFRTQLAAPPAQPQVPASHYLPPLQQQQSIDIPVLLAMLLMLPFYWQAYELLYSDIYRGADSGVAMTISTIVSVFLSGGVSFLLWSYVRFDSRLKIAGGLFLILLLLLFKAILPYGNGIIYTTLIMSGVSEMLVGIPGSSIIARYAPASWRATFFGLSYFIVGAFNWLLNKVHISYRILEISYIDLFIVIFCLLFAVFFLVYAIVMRKRPHSS
jgi:POT family proton-dependent oligopeptide transporter